MMPQDDATMAVEEINVGNENSALLAANVDDVVAEETVEKRSRRRVVVKRYNDTDVVKGTKKPRLEAGTGDCMASSETAVKSKKRSKDGNVDDDDMNWVCAECKEAECLMEPSADQFLLCDGVCSRVFHYPCAGLSKIPDTDEDWICKDCSQSRHQCAFCQEYGQDQVEVFRCRKDKCGLFFHESCLALNNVPVKMEQIITRNASGTQSSPRSVEADPLLGSDNISTSVPGFTCPAHHCWTCTQEEARKKEQKEVAAKKKAGGKKKKKGSKKNASSIYQCKTEGRVYVSLGAMFSA
jgi:hypothetical protein